MSVGFRVIAKEAAGARSATVEIEPGKKVRIGRLPENTLPIVWDREISREHAVAELDGVKLHVYCLEAARNPILSQGQPSRDWLIEGGGQFQIGQTQFRFEAPPEIPEMTAAEPAADVEELAFGDMKAAKFNFESISKQMMLLRDLPDMITRAATDVELGEMLCGLLLTAIPQAVAVAVASYNEATVELLKDYESQATRIIKPVMMRVQTRDGYEGRFVPSRRLVGRAFATKAATCHLWSNGGGSGAFTMADSLDWAFCVPLVGESTIGWCLYISGQGGKNGSPIPSTEDLEPDIRFTQLMAQFISSVRSVRLLQDHRSKLSSFFSPKVIETLTTSGADVLKPSERDITVLFCDVRGFSRKSEKYRNDLLYLLNCVREALSCMTGGILKYDGSIADFQGDAALGFWGWPVALPEGAMPACLAALAVQDEFLHPERHEGKLDGFTVGIGVAHGRAISGQIGTTQQSKIGVFGPVVNQGSRLEGMTKQFGVSICIDEVAAEFARKLPRDKGRVRKLARVRPKGMDTPMTVSQLLPPFNANVDKTAAAATVGADMIEQSGRTSLVATLDEVDANNITDEHIEEFERILELVISGKWTSAIEQFELLPDEGPKSFLLDQMKKHNNTPPSDWDGAFSLTEK